MKFLINKAYKFNTLAPSILGEVFTLMKVKSIMSAEEAVKHRDVANVNKQLLTHISGLSKNVNDNTYVLFENSDSTKLVLAYEWINADSIEEVSSTNIRIDVPNQDTSDIEVIKLALNELGYKNHTITTY